MDDKNQEILAEILDDIQEESTNNMAIKTEQEPISANKKTSLFGKATVKVKSATKWIGGQIDKGVNKIEEINFINSQFKNESNEYEIIYRPEYKTTLLTKNKFRAINIEKDRIFITDLDIKDVSKIDYLLDNRKQRFYIVRVLESKYIYKKEYDKEKKLLTKDLFQVEYSIEPPKKEVQNYVRYEDKSINAAKGSVVAVGDAASASKQTDINLGAHLHLPKE